MRRRIALYAGCSKWRLSAPKAGLALGPGFFTPLRPTPTPLSHVFTPERTPRDADLGGGAEFNPDIDARMRRSFESRVPLCRLHLTAVLLPELPHLGGRVYERFGFVFVKRFAHERCWLRVGAGQEGIQIRSECLEEVEVGGESREG